jgi:hypothetical protein
VGWFQLDPDGIVSRVRSSGAPARVPSLGGSILRGIVGLTIVSVAGFAPWALGGKGLARAVGEAGMYVACAAAFIGLTGPLLHRLIIGPGSLPRFCKLFGLSFAVYSAAWIAAWMIRPGHVGSLVGLAAGTAAMGAMIATAFDARPAAWKGIPALFLLNTIGYYAGGWVEGAVAKMAPIQIAMLLWGVCYGIGLGAGLGLTFYLCQKTVRQRLS